MTRTGDAAGPPGNHVFIRSVSLFVDLDAEKLQTIANASADHRRAFADTSRKTSVSTPPSAAAKAPIHFFTW